MNAKEAKIFDRLLEAWECLDKDIENRQKTSKRDYVSTRIYDAWTDEMRRCFAKLPKHSRTAQSVKTDVPE